MARELIGFFDNTAEAERVRQEVIASGIDKDCVKVFSEPGEKGREPGFWDKVKDFFGIVDEDDRRLYGEAAQHGAIAVAVDADTPAQENQAAQIMQRHNPIDLDYRAQEWGIAQSASTLKQPQQPPQKTQQQSTSAQQQQTGGEQVLPVVEEQLQVGKRTVQSGGIRVHTITREKPAEENVQLREEHVTVQRQPANRPVSPGDQAFQERTVEVRETAEEPVIGKTQRVVEEVRLKKDVQEREQTVRDTVRKTDVEIERLGPQDQQIAENFGTYLSSDQRYTGRDWDAIEPDIRRDFETRYPQSKWDQFQSAIRSKWERGRQSM